MVYNPLFYPPNRPPRGTEIYQRKDGSLRVTNNVAHKHVRNPVTGNWSLEPTHPRKPKNADDLTPLTTRTSGAVVINTYPLSPSRPLGNTPATPEPEVEDTTPAVMYWYRHYWQTTRLRAEAALTTDPAWRQLLSGEIEIGERKMAHWERHHNFDSTEAVRLAASLKSIPVLAANLTVLHAATEPANEKFAELLTEQLTALLNTSAPAEYVGLTVPNMWRLPKNRDPALTSAAAAPGTPIKRYTRTGREIGPDGKPLPHPKKEKDPTPPPSGRKFFFYAADGCPSAGYNGDPRPPVWHN